MKKPPSFLDLRTFPIFLLLLLCGPHGTATSEQVFEFTSDLYNLSLEENSVGAKYARSETATKIGVPLPEKDANCKFRIAEVAGEKSSLFKANAKQVGDFVFLRVRYKGDNPLNRELKDFYDILVKATCKRKDSSNLETTARVHLRVIDRNDASPVFLVDEQGYEVQIDDDHEPFSSVLQVEASDADIGMNSAIYYSLVNASHDFFVEPVTGWIRTLRHVKTGKYQLKVKAEDRASRLYYFDENEVQPSWTADVQISVRQTNPPTLKVSVTPRNLSQTLINQRQLAGVVELKDVAAEGVTVGLKDNFLSHWFEVSKEENDEWMVHTIPNSPIPPGTNVTLSIGSNTFSASKFTQNITKILQIQYKTEHSIKFEENLESTENFEKLVLKINELAPIGHIITRSPLVKLGHPEDQQLVRYSIENWNPNQSNSNVSISLPFSIGQKSGILRLKNRLKGTERSFNFDIIASLSGLSKSLKCSKKVAIEVQPANLHPPVWAAKWMRQGPISISSSKKIGDTLVKMDALDQDEGNNGKVVYKLTSEDPETKIPLKINASSGIISLTRDWPLNQMDPKKTSWGVTVWAIDMGTPLSRRAGINLVFYKNGTKIPPKPKQIIMPEPANKHEPIFTSFPDLLEVTEDAPIGTIIAKFQAEDADFGFNGLVRYGISDLPGGSEILKVDETTGEVSVASDLTKLMKEKKEFVEIELKVIATDAGEPQKSTQKTMKLRIKDVNNNAPIFTEPSYQLRVNEAEKINKEIFKVSATDFDGGDNGKVSFQLPTPSEKSIISIDPITGVIKLRKPLDRETQDVHFITIIATDNGVPKQMAFANLTLIVEDSNDNAPKCTTLNSRVRIPEDLPHEAFVGCISAMDMDQGKNSKLKYTLNDSKGSSKAPFRPFRVDHHTGCVFIQAPDRPLNFHETPFFNLSIEVQDHGLPSMLSTTCYLHVELVDVAHNHMTLEFDDVAKEASVYENSDIGTEVIMVEAKEGSDEKRKAEHVKYKIIGGDGWPYFSINELGTVKTAAPLDREAKSSYWISVQAEDEFSSGTPRSAVLHIFIRVLDRNDHRPVSKKPMYTASVPENSPADIVVVKVEATDADDAHNDMAAPLTFKIEKGDPQSFFRIDLTSGYITTSGLRRLDREKQAEHELWVQICDGGEPQLCSNVVVIVTVEDENDNAPAFHQLIHHYSVRTNFVGALCRVFAVDADAGDNGRLFYNITEGDERFSIDENGTITTSVPIHGDESYPLTVQATDRGSPAQFAATRVVLMAAGNGGKSSRSGASNSNSSSNHAPQISGKKADYVIPISDADQVGLTVGKLEATDQDGDDLWWSIASGNEDFVFDIRQDTGQLLLAKKVENLKQRELKLNVSVTDGVFTDYSIVIIQASQQVSKRPKFSAFHYQTIISEKVPVGTQIYTLKATGEPLTTKPLIFSMFSIDDISMEDKLRVEPSSGNVIVMEALDYETAPRIQGVVQVQQANMKSFATFTVDISDENDNAPQFVEHSMWTQVDERTPLNSIISSIKAFDKDSNENGIITYSLISGNEEGNFEIDSKTGDIKLIKTLDENSEFILRIRASDSSPRSLKDEMILHIQNGKLAEELKFEKSVYQIQIPDSTSPGTPLIVPWVLTHSTVTYAFLDNCTYFGVHKLSGAIHLNTWITKEISKSLECSLTVQNSEGRKDEAKISVKIQRTNQHAPVFKHQVYKGHVRENSPKDSLVLSQDHLPLVVSATDEDRGPNGIVEYKMLEEMEEFTVDQYSGTVLTKKTLDFEKRKEYQFYVQAFDMGHTPRRSLMPTLIIISIIDENDETPVFPLKSLQIQLLLPTANGISIGGQKAEDRDTVGGLRYFQKVENELFLVDSKTGDVVVKDAEGLKDLKDLNELKMEIFASDGLKSTSYTLKIVVQKPGMTGFRFSEPIYNARIIENTTYEAGTIIASVSTIGDGFGHSTYRILNPHDAFWIHPSTGVIATTGSQIDREESPVIRLIIQAKNQAKNQENLAQTLLEIEVEDINDNAPIFLNTPLEASISLEAEIGAEVLKVLAMDKDSGDNGKISFVSMDLPDVFDLLENGSIVLKQKLQDIKEQYTFTIEAQDSGTGGPSLKSQEIVKIRVVDGARPIFEQSMYTATITRKTLKDTVLARLSAKSNVQDGLIGYRILDQNQDQNQDQKQDQKPLVKVDFSTGEVRLSIDPRFLDSKELFFEVEAVEVTRPHLTSLAKLKIQVASSIEEQTPRFKKEKYEARIPESAAVGQRLLKVEVKSSKAAEDVSFSLGSEDQGQFSIDPISGDVFLTRPLDFEAQHLHQIFILATNPKSHLHTTSELFIFIEDVNDEKPIFLKDTVQAHVYDSALPGQFITIMSATDLDTVSSLPDAEKLLFRIVDGDETLFSISPTTGEVTLARKIEPEDLNGAKTVKTLNVSVTDGMFSAFAKLSVDILRNGAMQLPLRFEQSQYVASALENTIVNKSALLTVSSKNGILPFHYSLGSPSSSSKHHKNNGWPVTIDSKTGRIHVSRVLDFHNDKFYRIPLVVEDATRRRAFSTLTLTVIDINDKPPVFVSSAYSTSISETAKKGDTVLMVSATDDDENDQIEYTLLDGSESTFFSVHPRQGTITVIKKLAHKAGQTFSLTIKATDSANPPHHATTQVDINVASETLKIPRFSNSHYLFEVMEDAAVGTMVGRVQQVEVEIDEVRFTVTEAPEDLPFSVERSNGKIIVKSPLDRERKKQWKLAIRVDAAGGVHSMTAVTVDVGDVNDNAPAFHGDYEKLTISEDAEIGTSVTIFSAIDKDESPSGLIRFSLVNEDPKFAMNEQNGWLTVKARLDRETKDTYNLVARATDEGGFSTDLPFTVEVRDVNDSPPKFEKEMVEVEIDGSNIKNQETILQLKLQDSDLFPNNQSQMFISSGNEEGIFAIDKEGNLKVQRPDLLALGPLDPLVITAFDGLFKSSTKVVIKVLNKIQELKNRCDIKPKILKIQENAKKGFLVLEEPGMGMVSEGVTFELQTDLDPHPFVINFRNGIVKIKEPIDYEKHQYYEFSRISKISTSKEILCQEPITVMILNENDNKPVISQKLINVSIKENLPTTELQRQYLTTVKALDLDGDNLKYRLVSDFEGIFKIDENTGVLTAVKVLDSEKQVEYNLTVVANDGKWEDRATITILVIDQNDNAPTFEKSTYSIKVMESESVGYELAHFRASGGDQNESITFHLQNSSLNKYFSLDKETGKLVLAKPLDFEKIDRYDLTIIATDSGVPPLSSEAKINIIVMDENDNAPKFLEPKYIGKIPENSKVGTKVLKVQARDADKEHFGSVSYELLSVEKEPLEIPFLITESGDIEVKGPLDYETRKIYSLKVIAKDGGKPPLRSEVLLEIHVEDENDNSPIFEDCNMTAIVQEGANIGHTILKFQLTDLDGPKNQGPFKVTILGDGATSFKVTEDLRMITAKKLSAKKDKFLLTVMAKDVKGRSTDCPLTVYIRKESRHAPTIKPMIVRVNTLQNELPSGVIGRLKAFDEDSEDVLKFGLVEDSTKGPGRPHHFKIDPNTGEIWAEHSIPAGIHAFNVTVSDGKFTPISYVEVHVTSIDTDLIDHAVSIRIRSMTLQDFMKSYVKKFRKVISHHLNLDEDSIQLISVQEVSREPEGLRARRNSGEEKDVEILMAAHRGHSRGYLKPDHVYSRLKVDFQDINQQNERMRFQLITEMCTTGVCLRGECRESIELIEDQWTKVSTDTYSFVSPLHSRSAQCLCPDGFGGERCESEVNQCSKSPCERYQICVPSVQNDTGRGGFDCVCPLGMGGSECKTPTCNSGKCLEEAELSVGGQGFFEIFLSNEIETRMELEIELRTTTTNGVVLRTEGRNDFHSLLISNGSAEYTWDAGTGQGKVSSKTQISDGEWHRISISRRQRRTRMTIDDLEVQESFSPIGATVINLHRFAQKLVIGAKVQRDLSSGQVKISEGISACFKAISVDGRKIPKTRQGMKLYGAQPGCSALTSSPCNDFPCKNGGTCTSHGREFSCDCSSRYSGDQCEIDLEPCASHPCPTGIQCIPFFNDYLCKCPDGFTGKHCESRGFDDTLLTSCPKDACGTGQCISIPRQNQNSDFICNCTGGILQTAPCSDRSTFASILELFLKAEIVIVGLGLLFLGLVVCIAVITWKCCRKNHDPKYGTHCDVPHMRNTRVLMPTTNPPPLPPRGLREFPSFTDNTNSNRPMVQVRPFVPNNPNTSRHDMENRSDCGSSKGTRRELPSDKFRRADELNRARRNDLRGDSEQLTPLRASPDMSSIDERLDAALKYSRATAGALLVGDTELMPVVNDDDYMTMKPRKDKNFEREVERRPEIPAHRSSSSVDPSLLYDDPISIDSQLLDDIDEEVDIHIS